MQETIKQYRESFYLRLRERLAGLGIDLAVVYGAPGPIDAKKKDHIELPPVMTRKRPSIHLMNERVLLQLLAPTDVLGSDLIILDQATGCLHNYPLLLLSRLGLKKVAFWGHGYNRHGDPGTVSERLKKRLVSWCDHWFAYTPATASYLVSAGVAPERITSVDNAVDTAGFRALLDSVTQDEVAALRRKLGLQGTDRVALYCGSLYPEKRIPYLLEAARRIALWEPSFRLLVVGAGVESGLVTDACKDNPCLVYAGAQFGREKACCFRIADLLLHPGAVGLVILDGFAAALPLVTTADAGHGPEIDYLEPGVNGILVSGGAEPFATAVLDLLREPRRVEEMRQAALRTAAHFTVENMVDKMTAGIVASLDGNSGRPPERA